MPLRRTHAKRSSRGAVRKERAARLAASPHHRPETAGRRRGRGIYRVLSVGCDRIARGIPRTNATQAQSGSDDARQSIPCGFAGGATLRAQNRRRMLAHGCTQEPARVRAGNRRHPRARTVARLRHSAVPRYVRSREMADQAHALRYPHCVTKTARHVSGVLRVSAMISPCCAYAANAIAMFNTTSNGVA